jgi:hypothetical protein
MARNIATTDLIENANEAGFIFLDFEIRQNDTEADEAHEVDIDVTNLKSKLSVAKDFPANKVQSSILTCFFMVKQS